MPKLPVIARSFIPHLVAVLASIAFAAPSTLAAQDRYSCSASAGTRISIHDDNDKRRMLVVDRDHCLDVSSRGMVTFGDDDASVQGISSGGYLSVSETRGGTTRRATFDERGGALVKRYYENGTERTERELADWLRGILPQIARESTIGAEARAERLLRQRGASGLLTELAEVRSESVKEIYVKTLLADRSLPPSELRAFATRLPRLFSSDSKRTSLMTALLDRSGGDPAIVDAMIEGSRSMSSDHQRGLVLRALLARDLSKPQMLAMLRSTSAISSDSEKANLLVAMAERRGLLTDDAVRAAFLTATKGISSSSQYRRVMEAVVR